MAMRGEEKSGVTQWFRVHLNAEDRVDLRLRHPDHAEILLGQVEAGHGVRGVHPGGSSCVIPASSIMWAEIIEVPDEEPGTDPED